MSWWSALPVLLVVLVVALAPGAALLAALGVRGLPLFALAAPATAAILGVGAILAGFAGVPWQPWIGLLLTVVVAVVAWGLRRWWGAPEALRGTTPDRRGRILVGGMVVAALVSALPLARGIRSVDRVPQTWDAVFHLNALRYIIDTGRASSLLLGGVNNHVTGTGFYPAAWHVTAATVMQLTGADPAVVANLMVLVLAGLIIPAGTALASRALMPDWRWAGGVGAVAGSLFAALPAMMVSWGTLWPNAWGTGALPALLGAALLALRRPSLTAWTAILIGLGGAALLHPTSVFAFALLGSPLAVQALVRRWHGLRAGRQRRLVGEAAVLGALIVAVPVVLASSNLLGRIKSYSWGQIESMPQAVGEALLDAPLSQRDYGVSGASWLLGGIVAVGVVRAGSTRDQRAWVVSLAFAVGAYAISAGAPVTSFLRDYVTGYWYNDPVRLASLVPVVAAPLVVVGLRALVGWGRSALPVRSERSARIVRLVDLAGVPAVVVLVLLLTVGGYAQKRESRMTYWYWPAVGAPDRQLVTPAEEKLLRRIDELTPPNAKVLADPYGGGELAYALGDRQVVFPHLSGASTPAEREILTLMPDLSDPRTCPVLHDLGVDYLYVDPELYVGNLATHTRFATLDRAPSTGVKLLASADTAALYKITGCP
ncbi:MAG: hypothetical protein QOJ68_2621 [Blastococcus sp.]|jgi:hypothetical protein|nr:hypothetical protein [Blastococcus sp.]